MNAVAENPVMAKRRDPLNPVKSDDLSTYLENYVDPDLPKRPKFLVEFDRLVDRIIAREPKRRKAILAAARRFERACVGNRAVAGSEGRTAHSEWREHEVWTVLMDLKMNLDVASSDPNDAAKKVHELMKERWEEAGRLRPWPPTQRTILRKITNILKRRKELDDFLKSNNLTFF
jgi:hypothetical protein